MPEKPIAVVVDDEADALELCVRVLSKAFVVHTFQDPKEALVEVPKIGPTLVIADFRMPGLNGVDLCRELRHEGVRCAFLMVSAFSSLKEIHDGLAEGLMFQVLSKPFEPDDLLSYAEMAVASFQLSNAASKRSRHKEPHPSPGDATYNLAVVFDDVRRHFSQALRELTRLQEKLAPSFLVRIDLLFIEPSTLMCRLGFDPRSMAASKVAERLSVAQSRHFRVLDLMTISSADGEALYANRVESAVWLKTPSLDLRADLEELRGILNAGMAGTDRRGLVRDKLAIPVRFVGGPEPAVGLAKNVSPVGMYIESDILPNAGDKLKLTLAPLTHAGLDSLSARVIHVTKHADAQETGQVPGFGVVLNLSGEQRRLFESFIVSAVRGRPWPEQSGRRYERFNLDLSIVFDKDGAERRETVSNISRGGFFVGCDAPLPLGHEANFVLSSGGDTKGVTFRGRVVHCANGGELADPRAQSGMGVELLDDPNEIEKKLQKLMHAEPSKVFRRAFVLDDDDFFRTVLQGVLQRNGYDVIQASTAEQAFAKLLDELLRFDVLLIDLYLPGMSSRALIDWVRRADGYSDIAIAVITSADLKPEQEKKLLETGVDRVIHKTAAEADLLAAIDDVIVAREKSNPQLES